MILYFATFTLSVCSIIYELLLSEVLSAFLGNTVQQYSITIGIYLFSMGVGAMLIEKRNVDNPLFALVLTEIFLSLVGGSSVILIFLLNLLPISTPIFFSFIYLLIVIIGILTGAEIPLLIERQRKVGSGSEGLILGINYFGAFIGTLLFSFIFYVHFGLTSTSFFVALVNIFIGGVFALQMRSTFYFVIYILLLVVFFILFANSNAINIYFTNLLFG